jgi:hypothetical protein
MQPNKTYVLLPWELPGWLDEASAWIHERLAAAGTPATGPIEMLHQRPWSAFARVPTAHGTVFFKAPAPSYPFEAPLTEALAQWWPDCTVPLVAVERKRGWILSSDAGAALRRGDATPAQVDQLLKLLPRYAEVQQALAERVPELLALGVPDLRMSVFPQLYNQLLEDTENLMIGQELGLTDDEYRRLRDLRPRVAEWCQELAGYGLPETLVHEELHDANVLVNGDRFIYTDWSDCSVGHPFFTMLVNIRAAAHRLKLAEDGPEMARLRDAYVKAWTSFLPREDLMLAYELAYRLAMITRSLSWYEGTRRLSPEHKQPYADNVPGWLQDFLQATSAIDG